MSIKTLKNGHGPQKLLVIGPDPFISQSNPDHSPQPRIDFSYYEISGPDICSLICDLQHDVFGRPGFWLNPISSNVNTTHIQSYFHLVKDYHKSFSLLVQLCKNILAKLNIRKRKKEVSILSRQWYLDEVKTSFNSKTKPFQTFEFLYSDIFFTVAIK